jgi:hypothetical protein
MLNIKESMRVRKRFLGKNKIGENIVPEKTEI